MERRGEYLFGIAVGWLKDGEVECRCSDEQWCWVSTVSHYIGLGA